MTPPHPTAKASWGCLWIGVRKPRLFLAAFMATWNKVTAPPRSYRRGCSQSAAPSTVRPLARDPRVLVGWPFPLGFGLDGRLLLERRGRVYVQFTIIIRCSQSENAECGRPRGSPRGGRLLVCVFSFTKLLVHRHGSAGRRWCGGSPCLPRHPTRRAPEDTARGRLILFLACTNAPKAQRNTINSPSSSQSPAAIAVEVQLTPTRRAAAAAPPAAPS